MIKVKSTKKVKGFSLIELVITMGVISILALMIVMTLGQAISDAKVSTFIKNCKTIETAIYMFQVDNKGRYPVKSQDEDVFISKYLKTSLDALQEKPDGAHYSGIFSEDSNIPPKLDFQLIIGNDKYTYDLENGLLLNGNPA